MRLLLLDNYDSFTFNLRALLRAAGVEPVVRLNDKILPSEVSSFEKVVLSPGPGLPASAGRLEEIIRAAAATTSFLGVCLGHQAIAEVFGARLTRLPHPFHGVPTRIRVTAADPLFDGIGPEFTAGRYHSWAVSDADLPACLRVTARDADEGLIMALRHRHCDLRGVQFHPESVLTPVGLRLLENWLAG